MPWYSIPYVCRSCPVSLEYLCTCELNKGTQVYLYVMGMQNYTMYTAMCHITCVPAPTHNQNVTI